MKWANSVDEVLTAPPAEAVGPDLRAPWEERRAWFGERLRRQPPAGVDAEEIAAHFATMPAHYWARVNWDDLLWGLKTIHGFLNLVAASNVPATTPFIDWRPGPRPGQARIILCTWDRQGLLAKAAGALSAVHLNILAADVFTRTDNVVLDVFSLADSDVRGIGLTTTRFEELKFLIEGALSQPPRFASVWACLRHKYLAAPSSFAPRITFDNDSSSRATLVRVEAPDRLGLLYDLLQAIADAGLNLTEAAIGTEKDRAIDTLHVTGLDGQKITEPARLEELRQRLEEALTVLL